MKKFNLFATGMLAMFVSTVGVHAQDVSSADNLKDCLNKNETCTLTQDITLTNSFEFKGHTSTIDLNKHTLKLDGNTAEDFAAIKLTAETGAVTNLTIKNGILDATNSKKALVAKDKVSLTIDGVSVNGCKNDTYAVVRAIGDGASLTVANSEFTGNAAALLVGENNSTTKNITVNVSNTKIDTNEMAMSVNGQIKDKSVKIHLSDNAFTSKNTVAIYAAGYADWTIDSGSYTGYDALNIKSGKFNITGGTFHANGEYVNAPTYEGGTEQKTGSAISITSSNNVYAEDVELNIEGGTFTADKGHAIYDVVMDGHTTALNKINIEDGEFKGNTWAVYVTGKDHYINGGKYTGNVNDINNALNNGLSYMIGTDGVGVVGTEYTVTVKNLTAIEGVAGYNKPDNFPAVVGERISVLNRLGITNVPKDLNNRYAVRYVITTKDGKKITGLDEFTMPESDVDIDLEIVEVKKEGYKAGEDEVPSEPVGPDVKPGGDEPSNPDDDPSTTPGEEEKPPFSSGDGETTENPATGDNVMGSIAMGVAGLVGIVGSAVVFDKKTNYNN